jgi:hypothetical protein
MSDTPICNKHKYETKGGEVVPIEVAERLETAAGIELSANCKDCGEVVRYKIMPGEKHYKLIQTGMRKRAVIEFRDFCGFCDKTKTFIVFTVKAALESAKGAKE